jgi:hypothetical protein
MLLEAPIFSGGTMESESRQGLTLILGRARTGDERAREELIALVYDELRRVASRLMRRERTGHTLSPTAVVHEAVIRLLGDAVLRPVLEKTGLPNMACSQSKYTLRNLFRYQLKPTSTIWAS